MTETRMKERNGEHPWGDTGQLILLGLFLVVWGSDSFFLRKSIFLSDYLPVYIRLAILALTSLTAAYLFMSGHAVVRHEERPSHVATTGTFRYVRHPLYLGSILLYFGFTVSTASLYSLMLLIVIMLFYNYIAGYEESLLETKYGDDYRAYKKKTGKWLPRIVERT